MVEGDVRTLLQSVPAESITCTITSPPYGAVKDYGAPGQIGHGQKYETEYLPAMRDVLAQLHRVSKPGAALWVVLDTIKDNGAMTPLPWQMAALAGEVGWTFHDLVIWDKGRSLPWSHHGRFRNVVEYILLLGKGRLAHFNLDAIRDTENLGPYWVRYPERYHPSGKAPSDLWHFPIPVQGSWSKGTVRHLCPFPVALVARMVALTSAPGDLVLDCFAGTGSVPATAAVMGRLGVGFELNPDFVRAFKERVCDDLMKRAHAELQLGGPPVNLGVSIVQLRMQKYAKTLLTELSRADRLNGLAWKEIRGFVLRRTRLLSGKWKTGQHYQLGSIELDVLAQQGADIPGLRQAIEARQAVRPLSKFGIEAQVSVRSHNEWREESYADDLPAGPWYIYRKGRFYQLDAQIHRPNLHGEILAQAADSRAKVPALFSQMKLEIPLPHGG